MSDIGQLEARRDQLKGKMAAAKVQQRLNSIGSALGGGNDAVFEAMEEKVNRDYDEAIAIAELRAGKKDDLDELFAQDGKSSSRNAEDELAAIKEKMKKNK